MKHRIGSFLVFLGLVLLLLFLLSDMADMPAFNFLVGGVLALGFGVFLWLHDTRPPPAPSERFRTMRSLGKKKPPADKK